MRLTDESVECLGLQGHVCRLSLHMRCLARLKASPPPPSPPPSPVAAPTPQSVYPFPLSPLLSSRSWSHMCVFNPRFGTLPKTKPIASSPPQPIASSSLTPSHS